MFATDPGIFYNHPVYGKVQVFHEPEHGDPVGQKNRVKAPKAISPELPLFCDYSCTHASFAPNDATGACRKELAVYCTLLEQFNNKNSRCIAREGTRQRRA
jgi:hypothetical protein